jgi:dihydrofolate reductase
MKLALIAAVARNRAIGRHNELLWHEPLDAKHFRSSTLGCPVVMGRKTWDSLPERFRPLPGRRNLVVTRQPGWQAAGAEAMPSLDDALAALAEAPRVFVMGGGELYAQALARADELVLTEIDAALEGDVFFPAWNPAQFAEVSRESHPGSAPGRPSFDFVTYQRIAPEGV